MDRQIKA
jgi:hypothetical protein